MQLIYNSEIKDGATDISNVLIQITNSGLLVKDLKIEKSSLEDIFVDLVKVES